VPRRDVDQAGVASDVAPTLVSLLGGQPAPALDGESLLSLPPDRARWFVCWYDDRCRGFALGRRKVVVLPDRRRAFAFDLAEDPGEARPQPLLPAETALLPELQALVETHRTVGWDVQLPAIELGSWHCAAGGPCLNR
jgi:arylsulfatase A-like enzyme